MREWTFYKRHKTKREAHFHIFHNLRAATTSELHSEFAISGSVCIVVKGVVLSLQH